MNISHSSFENDVAVAFERIRAANVASTDLDREKSLLKGQYYGQIIRILLANWSEMRDPIEAPPPLKNLTLDTDSPHHPLSHRFGMLYNSVLEWVQIDGVEKLNKKLDAISTSDFVVADALIKEGAGELFDVHTARERILSGWLNAYAEAICSFSAPVCALLRSNGKLPDSLSEPQELVRFLTPLKTIATELATIHFASFVEASAANGLNSPFQLTYINLDEYDHPELRLSTVVFDIICDRVRPGTLAKKCPAHYVGGVIAEIVDWAYEKVLPVMAERLIEMNEESKALGPLMPLRMGGVFLDPLSTLRKGETAGR